MHELFSAVGLVLHLDPATDGPFMITGPEFQGLSCIQGVRTDLGFEVWDQSLIGNGLIGCSGHRNEAIVLAARYIRFMFGEVSEVIAIAA